MFAVYLPIYICTTASFYLSLQQTTEGWRKQPGDKTVYYVSTPSSKSKQAGQKLEIVTDSLQNRENTMYNHSLCIMSGIILVVYWKYTRSVMMHVFSRTVAAVDTKRGYVGIILANRPTFCGTVPQKTSLSRSPARRTDCPAF